MASCPPTQFLIDVAFTKILILLLKEYEWVDRIFFSVFYSVLLVPVACNVLHFLFLFLFSRTTLVQVGLVESRSRFF